MTRRFSSFNTVSLTLGLAFLYLPIAILIVYSFNASRLVTVWGGWSLRWYAALLDDSAMLAAAWTTLRIALVSATAALLVWIAATARREAERARWLLLAFVAVDLLAVGWRLNPTAEAGLFGPPEWVEATRAHAADRVYVGGRPATVVSFDGIDADAPPAGVAVRADRVIDRALRAPGDVALFAHAHILRVLTARWCHLPPQEGRRFVLATGTLSVPSRVSPASAT